MRLTPLRADGLLLFTALIWGIGFVPQQLAMLHIGPLTMTSIRFGIGALCLLPLLWLQRSRGRRASIPASWPWRGGLLAGMALAMAAALQQVGMTYTTVSSAGFITGLYVVFVPILGMVVGRPARPAHWLGATLAMGGLYFLTAGNALEARVGDLFVLAGAMCWAIQILVIDRFAAGADTLRLAVVQFASASLLTGALLPALEMPALAGVIAARWHILYSGGIAVALAFTLQITAQRAAPPAHAAILFSLEAVFAAIAGWLLLDEQLTDRQTLGCVVIFVGILCSQLDRLFGRRPEAGSLSA